MSFAKAVCPGCSKALQFPITPGQAQMTVHCPECAKVFMMKIPAAAAMKAVPITPKGTPAVKPSVVTVTKPKAASETVQVAPNSVTKVVAAAKVIKVTKPAPVIEAEPEEEEEPRYEPRKKKKKKKKKQVNAGPIIAYSIGGLVLVAVLIGAFFLIKYAIGAAGGGGTPLDKVAEDLQAINGTLRLIKDSETADAQTKTLVGQVKTLMRDFMVLMDKNPDRENFEKMARRLEDIGQNTRSEMERIGRMNLVAQKLAMSIILDQEVVNLMTQLQNKVGGAGFPGAGGGGMFPGFPGMPQPPGGGRPRNNGPGGMGGFGGNDD